MLLFICNSGGSGRPTALHVHLEAWRVATGLKAFYSFRSGSGRHPHNRCHANGNFTCPGYLCQVLHRLHSLGRQCGESSFLHYGWTLEGLWVPNGGQSRDARDAEQHAAVASSACTAASSGGGLLGFCCRLCGRRWRDTSCSRQLDWSGPHWRRYCRQLRLGRAPASWDCLGHHEGVPCRHKPGALTNGLLSSWCRLSWKYRLRCLLDARGGLPRKDWLSCSLMSEHHWSHLHLLLRLLLMKFGVRLGSH
mmetsp:Transcript_24060/g.55923  ORF Transcript_24060/g.55923 Transcript_24060/m.55923 type:complete len:250 (+) Transcript_24060:957-1706(+)